MNFTKMQGLGNEYLYVYGEVPENIEELSIRLSDRHFGAGSDGMIYISPSDRADFSMRIFNADGSEARMCGNGIRCVGKYVYDKGYTDKTSLRIETLSGIKTLELHLKDNKVDAVTVDMGKVLPGDEVGITALNRKWTLLPVSVGNPHAVCFVDDIDGVPLSEVGPVIEKHELFPGGVNSEFVQVLDKDRLRMRVWERGSGITLACGTGACASAMAAVQKGYCQKGKPITVRLDGGELEIIILEDGRAMMTGPAMTVYEGSTI
ncbi:MAG: diaminopimelate epimerase [Lachnospiraceae bacterium]|nr:diaminopimelate epimerase [Lachnospiraceae bacterium]